MGSTTGTVPKMPNFYITMMDDTDAQIKELKI